MYALHSLRARLSSLYSRITLNRITTAFFIFSFIHCFAQGFIQSFLFSIDAEYDSILSSITKLAEIPSQNLTYLEGSPGSWHLRICNDIPHGKVDVCTSIFKSDVDGHNPLQSLDRDVLALDSDNLRIIPNRDDSSTSNVTGITLMSGQQTVVLNQQCTQTMVFAQQIMHDSKREDITFVLLQFWLFAISVIAILYESVPHTLAVLITRFLITAWSAFAVWRTRNVQLQFTDIIFKSGTPCSFDVFPTYFQLRVSYEIPDLILNVTALLIASYLSWTLLRDYNAQSFKCVGAPEHINRINKFFMALLACLQLECFVLVAAGGLWIDVLINTAIAEISAHSTLYMALFIATTVLLIPWIAMGWYAIQHEKKILMVAFLGIAFFYVSGWSIMFYSRVYRWSFMQWPYLGCYTVASFVLLFASTVLGIICRLNFGKGLAQYLHAEAALASTNFAPDSFKHDEEKGNMDLGVQVPATFEGKYDDDFKLYAAPFSNKRSSIEKPRPAHVHVSTPKQTSPYKVPYNVPF